MSLTGSSKWKAKVFDEHRTAHHLGTITGAYVRVKDQGERNGWILFGPQDVRGGSPKYHFALQKLDCDNQLRVRVGCRYYTLAQAWKHWTKRKDAGTTRRNHCRQAIAIITLMLNQAQAYGLLPTYRPLPKFDSSIVKPKRK